jgi:hypothetical protein
MCVLLDDVVHTVFGKPLEESLKYANVQISTANANGELYVWGYIPVVVAKWCVQRRALLHQASNLIMCSGLYLKENGIIPRILRSVLRSFSLQQPKSREPFVSMDPPNGCVNSKQHLKLLRGCVLSLTSLTSSRTIYSMVNPWSGQKRRTRRTTLQVYSEDISPKCL